MEAQAQVTAEVKLEQKEAVFQFTAEALNQLNAPTIAKTLITKDVRKAVRTKLFDGMKGGTVLLKHPKSDSDLKKYCSSVINNWLNKDPRFTN